MIPTADILRIEKREEPRIASVVGGTLGVVMVLGPALIRWVSHLDTSGMD